LNLFVILGVVKVGHKYTKSLYVLFRGEDILIKGLDVLEGYTEP